MFVRIHFCVEFTVPNLICSKHPPVKLWLVFLVFVFVRFNIYIKFCVIFHSSWHQNNREEWAVTKSATSTHPHTESFTHTYIQSFPSVQLQCTIYVSITACSFFLLLLISIKILYIFLKDSIFRVWSSRSSTVSTWRRGYEEMLSHSVQVYL